MRTSRALRDGLGPLQITLSVSLDDGSHARIAAALSALIAQALGQAVTALQEGSAAAATRTKAQQLVLRGRQVAKLMGVSEKTWWNLWTSGKAPKPMRLASIPCWGLEEIRSWAAAGCPDQTAWADMRTRKA